MNATRLANETKRGQTPLGFICARRIVSLVPSITETLCEFGMAGRIVGITDYCIHPARSLRRKARVGGPMNPSLRKILSLKPDLLIASDEENRKRDVQALARKGIPVYVCRVRGVDDALEMMRVIAAMCPAASGPQAIIRETESLYRARPHGRRRTRVACLVWKNPYMSCGADTYISRLIEACGGLNVFHARRRNYFPLTVDELARARPQLVLLPTEPYRFRRKDREEILAHLRERGLRGCRARIVEGEMIAWYGARTRRALKRLPSILR